MVNMLRILVLGSESLHLSMVSGLCPRAIGIHPLNADCSDCCARHVMLTVRSLGLSCIRHCSCAPDCLQLDHGLLCVSFGRTVHLCTAESLQRFSPFGIFRLPLTVERDESDPPRADRSPLGTPTQPLRHPRVERPIVRVCASSTVHHRAPGFSGSLGFSITLPVPMSPWTLKASVLPNTQHES